MTALVPDIDLSSESITLVVAWWEGRTLAAGGIGLERTVAARMRTVCASTLATMKERRWRPDDPEAHLTDDEGIHAARSNLGLPPPVLTVLDRAKTFQQLSVETLPSKSLLLYAVIAGDPPDRYVAFLRKVNPHVTCKAGRFVSVLGDRLARVEGAVFQFDDAVDLVVTEADVFVLSMTVYELLFRETEPLTARIPAYVGTIAASLPLAPDADAGLQALAAKSSRLRSRLRTLATRGYLPHVTIDALAESARRQGIDPKRLIRDNQLILDADDPHLLLQVLNEDLYTGDLSMIQYAVDRKAARPQKGR